MGQLNELEQTGIDSFIHREKLCGEHTLTNENLLSLSLRVTLEIMHVVQNAQRNPQIFNEEENVQDKSDGSPVTKIDRAAEDLARKAFYATFPGIGFYGEEFEDRESQNEYRVILDPVDGTNALISNDPRVGVNLAIQKNKELVLAIVANTATGQICYSIDNDPTRLIQLPQLLMPSSVRILPDPHDKLPKKTRVLTRFRGSNSPVERTLYKMWNRNQIEHLVSPAGSAALNFIDVAKGLYTYVHEWFYPSGIYDLTGKKLVENAGGKVIDLEGDPIKLEGHKGVFIAGTDENEIKILREAIKEAVVREQYN